MELMIICLVLLVVAGHYIPLKRSGTFFHCLSLAAALLVPLHLLVTAWYPAAMEAYIRIYRRLGYWGPIDPIRMLDINGTMIQVFFDKHLKGMAGEPNEEISDRFPEVSLVSSQSSENSLSSWR